MMGKLFHFTILYILMLNASVKNCNVQSYEGYIIALVPKNIYDSHYSNEYFFLPNDYNSNCAAVNPDSLENHYPRLEKNIKKRSGFIISNDSHADANSENYIRAMYFYADSTLTRPNSEFFIKKYDRTFLIYAVKAKFKAEYSLDYINKTYWKLYIKDVDTLMKLDKDEIRDLKNVL